MTRSSQVPLKRGAAVAFLAVALSFMGGCRDDPTAVTPPCGDAPALAPGASVTAILAPGDARRSGPYIHYYTVWPTRPGGYLIEMNSDALDPFLYLFDESGTVVTQSFDRVAGTGARSVALEVTLQAGCHTVGASAWDAGATGSYVLSVEWTGEAVGFLGRGVVAP